MIIAKIEQRIARRCGRRYSFRCGSSRGSSVCRFFLLARRAEECFLLLVFLERGSHQWVCRVVQRVSPAEKIRYQMLIQNAKSLSEVARLEKEVAEGRIPPGVADSEAMDET